MIRYLPVDFEEVSTSLSGSSTMYPGSFFGMPVQNSNSKISAHPDLGTNLL